MLDNGLKAQVQSIFSGLHSQYTLRAVVAQSHPQRNELLSLLESVASCSDKVNLITEDGNELYFTVEKDGIGSSIIFRTVPNGHEFSTLLLAILNLDGKGKNLPDDVVAKKIKNLKGKHTVKTYISLSCTNCPEVVQALNVISIINPDITHELIDGAIYQDEVNALNIQAVPSVVVDNKLLHAGRASLGELLKKLEDYFGSQETDSQAEVKTREYDVVVAGGGPAGTTAAIYAVRKGLKVALIADRIGGQVLETVGIENISSIRQTTGKELGFNLKNHVQDYPVDIFEQREILSFEKEGAKNIIKTSLGEQFSSRALVIATGSSWRKLNVPGESEHIGNGVAFCTHCDGPFYKDKRVVVVGGGNSGLEAAIDLASIATHVTVLEYADTLKGDKVLQEKLKTFGNATVITNAQTQEVLGKGGKVVGIKYKNRLTDEESLIDTDGIFVQIGLSANSKPFTSVVETNKMGEILTDLTCRTSVPGVYAAGDVTTVPYKQIVIAMGEGAKAALSLFEDSLMNII